MEFYIKSKWAYPDSSCITAFTLTRRIMMAETVYYSPPNPSQVAESSSL